MRRACYLLGLLGCGLWYLLSGSWLGWILLLALAALPWLSLLLTVPALCTFSLTPTGPDNLQVGENGTFLLLGACQMPMPPFQGKLQFRNLRTNQITSLNLDRILSALDSDSSLSLNILSITGSEYESERNRKAYVRMF